MGDIIKMDFKEAGKEGADWVRTPLIWRLRAPDQGRTVDFFLFPRLKSIMKGAGFADVAEIQERVTAVLRSVPKVPRSFMNVANSVL
jgi:hypothetical protein